MGENRGGSPSETASPWREGSRGLTFWLASCSACRGLRRLLLQSWTCRDRPR